YPEIIQFGELFKVDPIHRTISIVGIKLRDLVKRAGDADEMVSARGVAVRNVCKVLADRIGFLCAVTPVNMDLAWLIAGDAYLKLIAIGNNSKGGLKLNGKWLILQFLFQL